MGKLSIFNPVGKPSVTVLVAARNEEASIKETLDALIAQVYPAEKLEVIVIDDNSTDRTTEIVKAAIVESANLQLVSAPPFIEGLAPKKNALLAGINASSGEIILTTDADCRPGTGWVGGMAGYFGRDTAAVVGYSPLGGGIAGFDAFINGVISAGTIGLGYPITAVGRNFAYRREVFEQVGGFGSSLHSASGDDDLLLQRIARQGGEIVFARDPVTFVPARGATSLGNWLRMKRRHLSAGAHYSPGMVGLFAGFYIFHAGLLGSIVTSFIGTTSWTFPLLLWGCKMTADYFTVRKGAIVLEHKKWFGNWITAELISPLLVCIVTPSALIGKVKWKDRKLER